MISRKVHLLLARVFSVIICAFTHDARSEEIITQDSLRETMARNGVEGGFVGYAVTADRPFLVNDTRARKRFTPASTFKIANRLIALETGVMRDENGIIPHHSQTSPLIKQCAHDMLTRAAIKLSNAPIYQELAHRIGLRRYHS